MNFDNDDDLIGFLVVVGVMLMIALIIAITSDIGPVHA